MILHSFIETFIGVFIFCVPMKKKNKTKKKKKTQTTTKKKQKLKEKKKRKKTPKKQTGNLKCKIEIWLLLFFFKLCACILQYKNIQYFTPFSLQEFYLGVLFSADKRNPLHIRIWAVAEIFWCTIRPNLSEAACQESCGNNLNWGIYQPKEATYFNGVFCSSSAIKNSVTKVRCFNYENS